MSKNILLSQKHGLNPSLDCCFYCGEAKGLAILGRLPGDKEAPRNIVTSLEPCDACKLKFEHASLIIEADLDSNPTGRWLAIPKESIKEASPKPAYFILPEDFNILLSKAQADRDEDV